MLIWPLSSLGETCSSTGVTWARREAVMGPGQANTEAEGHRAWGASGQVAAAFSGAQGREWRAYRERREGLVL